MVKVDTENYDQSVSQSVSQSINWSLFEEKALRLLESSFEQRAKGQIETLTSDKTLFLNTELL